jgi:hypothetical protein
MGRLAVKRSVAAGGDDADDDDDDDDDGACSRSIRSTDPSVTAGSSAVRTVIT